MEHVKESNQKLIDQFENKVQDAFLKRFKKRLSGKFYVGLNLYQSNLVWGKDPQEEIDFVRGFQEGFASVIDLLEETTP